MSKMIFLEVDKEDQSLVKEHLPEAEVIGEALSAEEVVKRCADAEVVSTFIYTAFPREVIAKLPKLKLLCTRSVGYNHIDLKAAEEKGIIVANVPDYGSHVIAEHAFALLLSALRHIHEGDKRVEGGEFDYHGLRGMALKGKTLGVVGTGKIGSRVTRIAHGFGMHILCTDICRNLEIEYRYGCRYVPFEELLSRSDIVTLHTNLTEDTRHMIDASAIAKMKDGAILVNTARGELVDSGALLQALKSGKISHALLDVLEHEKDFALNKELIGHPRVVITPHIAFYADDSMRNMYLDCFQTIEEWKKGEEPAHTVDGAEVVCDVPGVKK